MRKHIEEVNQKIEETLDKSNGDIFLVFLNMYDYMLEKCMTAENLEFFKNIFENMKTSQDEIFSNPIQTYKTYSITHYLEKVDTSKLEIKNAEDLKSINRILYAITMRAIVSSFRLKSKKEAREEYIKQLNFVKYGVLKK